MSGEKLKAHLYAGGDRRAFADETVGRLGKFVERVPGPKSGDDHPEHVRAAERAFGNYELKVANSVGSIFTEINYRLAVKARETKNVL